MQVFFAAVGANASIAAVVQSCPALFLWCFLQISVHLSLTLGVGRMTGFSRRDLLLASNANVGGKMLVSVACCACNACCTWQPELLHSDVAGT